MARIAKSYFKLKDWGISTLPYITFENKYYSDTLGRSYTLGNIHPLVSRKRAFLASLHEALDSKPSSEAGLSILKRGKELFDAEYGSITHTVLASAEAVIPTAGRRDLSGRCRGRAARTQGTQVLPCSPTSRARHRWIWSEGQTSPAWLVDYVRL
jgi:hypothetical protein